MDPYFSLDNIGEGVFHNTIAYMNHFANSSIAFWHWGMFWSALGLGCRTYWSPPAMGSGSTWARVGWSDRHTLLRRVDFSHLSSVSGIIQAWLYASERGVCANETFSLLLCFGNAIMVVQNTLCWCKWYGSWTACWWSILLSFMTDNMVHPPVSSLSISALS